MKKALFIALVVAFAASASIAYAIGEMGTTQTTASTFYLNWDPTLAGSWNNAFAATPHTGYAANTVKCAVCHSVHDASTNGELLLQKTVAQSCIFCHITNPPAGTTAIYAGVTTNYTVDSHFNHAYPDGTGTERTGTGANAQCSDCHAVHGAGIWNFSNTNGILNDGVSLDGIESKILKKYESGSGRQAFGGLAIPAGYQTSGGNIAYSWDAAITTFCTQCHSSMFAQTSQDNQYGASGTSDSDVSNYAGYTHPMIHENTFSTFDPAAPATPGYTGQVAWVESGSCRSCHGAGTTDFGTGVASDSFPHYTNGAYFLLGADNAQPGTSTYAASFGSQDGVCLRCHRGWTSNGVGMSF